MTTSDSTINPDIFKAYDVRGIYGQNLTEETVYRIGHAAALYLNVPEIAVCRDMRVSSPQLAAASIKGITDHGVNVIDCGLTTTDELYFIVGNYNYPAGMMITASHNPGLYNGIKFCRAQAYPISLDTGLDGITIDFGDWWFNVRPSNTEPLLRLYSEANSRPLMEQKRDEVVKYIRE
jgi:phosphomannomutase